MDDLTGKGSGRGGEVIGLRPWTPAATSSPAHGLIYFPEAIQTTEDSPVLLNRLVSVSDSPDGDSGVAIVAIDGVDITAGRSAMLPGIRVGEGQGAGYVFRREIDGELMFSPDFGFSGVTAFTYTIADVFGDTATLVATLSVTSGPEEPAITFADGSQNASLVEGVDAAIVGALNFELPDFSDEPVSIVVYEGDAHEPSQRFVVAGDKLQLNGGIDPAADATIPLRIVASIDGLEIAAGEFEIEVRPLEAVAARPDLHNSFLFTQRPTLAYSADADLLTHASLDQLSFDAVTVASDDPESASDDLDEPLHLDPSAADTLAGVEPLPELPADAGAPHDAGENASLLPTRSSDITEI